MVRRLSFDCFKLWMCLDLAALCLLLLVSIFLDYDIHSSLSVSEGLSLDLWFDGAREGWCSDCLFLAFLTVLRVINMDRLSIILGFFHSKY